VADSKDGVMGGACGGQLVGSAMLGCGCQCGVIF
jgi:hypothetical protein